MRPVFKWGSKSESKLVVNPNREIVQQKAKKKPLFSGLHFKMISSFLLFASLVLFRRQFRLLHPPGYAHNVRKR